MKRVRFYAGMGFSGATHEMVLEYDEDEFAELTEDELYQIANEFAEEYVEAWYEVEE